MLLLIFLVLLSSQGKLVHGTLTESCQFPFPNQPQPALGEPKQPCPPCLKSSWTYLTSEYDDVNHGATVVDSKDVPSWLGCFEREDSVNTFSVFGSQQKNLDAAFIDEKRVTGKKPQEFDIDVNILYQPTSPCEVQVVQCPPEKVIECKDRIMLAHEDEYRRQCKETFVKNFEYKIKKGTFDQDLAAYWLEYDPAFVRLDDNGDLKVTYDYTTFGCPIEPYQEDEFAPDLRILTEDMHRNTSLGLRYNHSYILIEIFGTKGFLRGSNKDDTDHKGYLWDPENFPKDKPLCIGKPQTLVEMLKIWKKEPFIPKTTARDPLSIWKDYKNCNGTPKAKDPWSAGKYEIMNNNKYDKKNNTNKLVWNGAAERPETLIFLAITIDDPNCTYYTLFGVSLPKPEELGHLHSLLWFIFFTLLLLLLVILGYYWRKAQIRRQYFEEARSERLKQSAWAVIYRYEKLLHESENKQIEKEMRDHISGDNAKAASTAGGVAASSSKKPV